MKEATDGPPQRWRTRWSRCYGSNMFLFLFRVPFLENHQISRQDRNYAEKPLNSWVLWMRFVLGFLLFLFTVSLSVKCSVISALCGVMCWVKMCDKVPFLYSCDDRFTPTGMHTPLKVTTVTKWQQMQELESHSSLNVKIKLRKLLFEACLSKSTAYSVIPK